MGDRGYCDRDELTAAMSTPARPDPLEADLAVPLDSPLYVRSPGGWVYRDVAFTAVTFTTDERAALAVLPEPLRPLHSPPRATIVVLECRESSFGSYNEIKFELAVEFDGEPYRYCPYIMVSALDEALAPDAAMAMGREVMGTPKKIGRITVTRDAGQVMATLERPLGMRIVTLSVATRETVALEQAGLDATTPVIHLRQIPSVDGGPPSIAELIRWDTTRRIDERGIWRGPATVDYGVASAEDPWHRLRVGEVLGAVTFTGELDIPPTARVMHDYRARREL
jgi:acetoacetate decarboxylase